MIRYLVLHLHTLFTLIFSKKVWWRKSYPNLPFYFSEHDQDLKTFGQYFFIVWCVLHWRLIRSFDSPDYSRNSSPITYCVLRKAWTPTYCCVDKIEHRDPGAKHYKPGLGRADQFCQEFLAERMRRALNSSREQCSWSATNECVCEGKCLRIPRANSVSSMANTGRRYVLTAKRPKYTLRAAILLLNTVITRDRLIQELWNRLASYGTYFHGGKQEENDKAWLVFRTFSTRNAGFWNMSTQYRESLCNSSDFVESSSVCSVPPDRARPNSEPALLYVHLGGA